MFFFFKQKTAYEIYQCDWSSDVCSSDLLNLIFPYRRKRLKKALKLGAEREGIGINLEDIPEASSEKRVFQLTPEEIAELTGMLGG